MNKWDKRFFELCDVVGNWSEDIHTKVGAVIVGAEHEVISIGFNGLPRGVLGNADRYTRDLGEKYHWFEHAERNSIYNAARMGVSCRGATLYCNLFPCVDCTRSVIQSGIVSVKTYQQDISRYGRAHEVSLIMIEEAGIKLEIFNR